MTIYCNADYMYGACGVLQVYNFEEQGHDPEWADESLQEHVEQGGGAGWLTAGFINSEECREAYELLCEKATLVYQTPVRENKRTHNQFFFCVFDTHTPSDSGLQPHWPL